MKNFEFILEEQNIHDIKNTLVKIIRNYNYQFLDNYELKSFAIYLKNGSEIIAGVCGY